MLVVGGGGGGSCVCDGGSHVGCTGIGCCHCHWWW